MPPLITFRNLSLAYGEDQVLHRVELSIEKGDRIAVAGRNGAGKSTLLKLICGDVTEDEGVIWRADHLRIVALPQELPLRTPESVYDSVASVFSDIRQKLTRYHQLTAQSDNQSDSRELAQLHTELEHADGWNLQHRIEATLDRLGLNAEDSLDTLSGGWLKRVGIARSLVQAPDVWILDEPTNHLDLAGIEWLEQVMLEFPGTVIFVSHDRQMMQKIATSMIEIDRGRLTRYDCDYLTFIERRDRAREIEAEHDRQFDTRLASEETWIRQGIKARRTRNEGRVRALKAMRAERAKRTSRGQMKLKLESGAASGKIVLEAESLNKSIDGQVLISDLDLIIQRGDRIGLLGPNGCGKSTLLKLLLSEIEPDGGKVRTGTRLEVAYFDQVREQLDGNRTVFDYIAEGRDFIDIAGKTLHVISYLQNFLFSPDQSRAPIRTLSGGEQNRLLLAKLFALPANLLVLDEPTNDLDIETLELLEELLIDYDGTVLLVSHDRRFMDNVVSSLLVFEGEGRVTEYVGGYADWASRVSASAGRNTTVDVPESPVPATDYKERKRANAQQKKQARDLEKVTAQIEQLEKQIADSEALVAEPEFFQRSPTKQAEAYDQLQALQLELDVLMTEWERLEESVFRELW
jgi:ATP-binding cassette subfamily F protein uup